MTRTARAVLWIGIASIVVLPARVVAYAVQPSVTARLLEHEAGGPALPTLVLSSLALGAAFAITICWLAALGVRERALLERRALEAPVRPLPVGRTIVLALALSVATSLAGDCSRLISTGARGSGGTACTACSDRSTGI